MFNFGTGYLFGNPNAQNLSGIGTPEYFGTVQGIDVEIGATIKELRGNLQFPDDTAIADKKISGKVTFGRIEVPIFNQLFFADSFTTGTNGVNPFVTVNAAATVTAAPPNSGVFLQDLGVRYTATGLPFTRVTSGPAVGQYSVNAGTGVYSFNATDVGVSVQYSYAYTQTTGNTLTVNNQLQGYGPQFEMWLTEPYSAAPSPAVSGNGMRLYACKAGKLNAPRKRDDYTIIELDFEGFANPAGKVFDWYQVSA